MQRPFVNAMIVCAAFGLVAAPLARAQERPEDKDHPAEQREAPHPAAGPARAPADQHAVRHDETVRNHETVINHTDTRIVQGGGGHWHSGDRFNGSRVVFQDWGRYHLEAPPPGYEWVQDGNELVLINLNTGLVSTIFLIP
jgi:Ni/Co efflux regulator RcnB